MHGDSTHTHTFSIPSSTNPKPSLRALIKQKNATRQSGGASSVDLDSKRLAKRLEGLFEKLTVIGFRESQVASHTFPFGC